MQNSDQKRRKQLVLIAVIVLIVIIGVSLLIARSVNTKRNGTNTETYDQNSGETYSTITGKSPETYGQTTDQPTYLGLDKLLDRGLSLEQIKSLQTAYGEYIAQSKNKVTIVSVKVASITKTPHSEADPALAVISYDTVFDNKSTFKTQLQYSGLSFIDIKLTDSSGKDVFHKSYDSDAIDTKYDHVDE